MKKKVLYLVLLGYLFSCRTVPIYQDDVRLEREIKKYLASGVVLSDISPAPGYHSESKAVLEAARQLSERGTFNLTDHQGNSREWLLDSRVQQPILIYDFIFFKDISTVCDYRYLLYAEHPRFGVVGLGVYNYYAKNKYKTGDVSPFSMFTVSPESQSTYSSILRKHEAKAYLSKIMGYTETSIPDPFAVYIPFNTHFSDYRVFWYFSIPGSECEMDSEYLIDAQIYPYDPRGERISQFESSDVFYSMPAKVCRIIKPLHLNEYIRKDEGRTLVQLVDRKLSWEDFLPIQ